MNNVIINKMRKIYVLEFLTLDGVMQAPGGSKEDASEGFKYGGWMGPFFGSDEIAGKEMEDQMKMTAALLLGRKTYEIFSGFWPHHATETEGWPQINKIPKYVMSKTLKNPTWENTEVINDIDELRKLKNSDGPDLQVYGSADLIQTLMKHDLVDEFWLKIFPLTLGVGKKLFQDGTMPQSFKVIDAKIGKNGVLMAKYRRDGDIKLENIA